MAKANLKVLALFDAIRPTTLDQDLSSELATEIGRPNRTCWLR